MTDEGALTADFAETYGVHDLRALPPTTAAALCFHLPLDSRVKSRQMGLRAPLSTYLLAVACDRLAAIHYAIVGGDTPKSIAAQFIDETESEAQFSTPDEFERFRASVLA